jgi:hypothetical protein
MDRMTAECLASTAPNPTQASLDSLIERTTRVRLVGSRVDENRRFQFDVVRLDASDVQSLGEFRACMRILETPDSFSHMMMIEDSRLELWSGDERLAVFGWLAGTRLRWWSVWKNDALLSDPEQLREWVNARLIPDSRLSAEKDSQS